MNNQRIKGVIIVWMIAVLSVCGYAGEAKGYKVVLASYPTFKEAKENLDQLGSRLGDEEKALQKRYGYEIVARPAGRSYIIGIEPLSTKEERETVLSHFKRLYNDAYGDKYYGPTEGAVVLGSTVSDETEPKPDAAKDVPVSEAVIDESAEELPVVLAEVDTVVSEETESRIEPAKEESPYFGLYEGKKEWFWIIAAITLLFIVSVVWIRSLKWKSETNEVQAADDVLKEADNVEIAEEEKPLTESFEAAAEGIQEIDSGTEEQEEVSEAKHTDAVEAEEDMFHRLKKNMFFMTVIEQLKEAADNQDAQRCRDLMDEVQRYQKNFRSSPMIAEMNELINAKAFADVSRLISEAIG